jgi:hypothetical protein
MTQEIDTPKKAAVVLAEYEGWENYPKAVAWSKNGEWLLPNDLLKKYSCLNKLEEIVDELGGGYRLEIHKSVGSYYATINRSLYYKTDAANTAQQAALIAVARAVKEIGK